eukprot:scaffold46960_cov84-Phaeocystis_antarctica.AAC.1
MPLPPPPPPLQPGAVNEIVLAKEVTLVLKAGGTVEEYEAKADAVKARLRQELQCSLPACVLTVTVKAGSVILTVVATDTAGGASQVESAAVALQTQALVAMSSALGVTIEEAPAAPSVIDVQVQVMRLAPSPPPPSPQPPSVGVKEATGDSVATEEEDGPGLAIGLALVGGCMLVGMLCAAMCVCYRQRFQSCMDSMAKSATTNTPAKMTRAEALAEMRRRKAAASAEVEVKVSKPDQPEIRHI